jgi:8-oxo-dGTP pyrophosphatase MutT (NUDIX family)
MKFKKFYKLYLESIEDEILSQKGEYHLSSGNDNRFFGNAGAGILVYCVKTKRFLLGFRSKLVNEPNTWGTFGGKIDNDADPKAAARRELKEETGYNGNINIQLFDVFQNGNFKFYNFLGKVEEEFEPILDWENDSAEWFSLDSMSKLNLHFGTKRLLEKLSKVI